MLVPCYRATDGQTLEGFYLARFGLPTVIAVAQLPVPVGPE